MTNPNLAYVQLIIDRSGSMHPLQQTVVSGVNDFLDGQRKLPGVCHVGLCWFGDQIDRPFDNRPLTDVQNLVLEDYAPSGGTPLNEAICTSIDALGARFAALPEADRPSLVTIMIITDGEENTSKAQFTAHEVKRRIEEQSNSYKWNFQYLCANQDLVLAKARFGLSGGNVAGFAAKPGTTRNAFMAVNNSVSRGRSSLLRGEEQGVMYASMAYNTEEVDSMGGQPATTVMSNATISPLPAP